MNLQQQNKINTLWEGTLKGLVLALVKQFGTAALEWLKNKLDELIESGEAGEAETVDGDKRDSHGCIIGREIWNPITNRCEDDL